MPFHLPRSWVLGPSHYTKWHPSKSKSCKGNVRVPCPSKRERSAAVPRGSILLSSFYTRVCQDCSTTPCSDAERCSVRVDTVLPECFWRAEEQLDRVPTSGIPWLWQELHIGDRRECEGAWSSAVTGAGWWTTPPGGLRKPRSFPSRETVCHYRAGNLGCCVGC